MPKCKQIALNFKFSKKNSVDKQIWNNFSFYWNLNTKQKPARCQALKVNRQSDSIKLFVVSIFWIYF